MGTLGAFVVAFVLAGGAFAVLVRFWRQDAAAAETVARFDNATRLAPVAPTWRCVVASCTWPATRRSPGIGRGEGLGDLWRRQHGAAHRYHVRDVPGSAVCYCEAHAELARQLCVLEVVAFEADHANLLRAWEARLGEFERTLLEKELASTRYRPILPALTRTNGAN